MQPVPSRLVKVVLAGVCVALAAGCGGTAEPALPDVKAPPSAHPTPLPQSELDKYQNASGTLKSADRKQIVINVQGKDQPFLVRPENEPVLDVKHLASHAGIPELSFTVYYEEIDGKRYAIAVVENASPQ